MLDKNDRAVRELEARFRSTMMKQERQILILQGQVRKLGDGGVDRFARSARSPNMRGTWGTEMDAVQNLNIVNIQEQMASFI